jgi:hypothetical protein
MRLLTDPRALAEFTEIDPEVPSGSGDRFAGYGIMGLPFASGHVLALRRFPASSLGYGYSSVWHRDPDGHWTFWSDVEPEDSCARFFGRAIDEAIQTSIQVRWTGPYQLSIIVGDRVLEWHVGLAASPATLMMNAAGRLLSDRLWRSQAVLRGMERVTSRLLGLGEVSLVGCAPNGQGFIANPRQVWRVDTARARVHGVEVGPPGPLPQQAWLGDFALPQRGVFAIGRSYVESFDPARHSRRVVRRLATSAV